MMSDPFILKERICMWTSYINNQKHKYLVKVVKNCHWLKIINLTETLYKCKTGG